MMTAEIINNLTNMRKAIYITNEQIKIRAKRGEVQRVLKAVFACLQNKEFNMVKCAKTNIESVNKSQTEGPEKIRKY